MFAVWDGSFALYYIVQEVLELIEMDFSKQHASIRVSLSVLRICKTHTYTLGVKSALAFPT